MAHIRKFILALLLIAGVSPAIAQQFPTVPSGTVIGRTQAGTGPAQAIPFATLIATMLASSPTIPTLNTSSILFAGSVSGTATLKAQSAAGTPTIQLPTGSGTLLDSVTAPLTATAAGNVSCPNCAVSVSTRTAAAAQDLSAYSFVRTNGYASVGDGGGAVFKNIGTSPFDDANVAAGTIAGGSSYTNGTYLFVEMTGGTGHGFYAKIVVSGGAVTSVTPVFNAGGYGYAIGDVLTTANTNIGGTGSGFTYTVTTLSTPKASFTDAGGNHWQYVIESFIDPRQFGAKFDWISTDSGATDDTAALQAALGYAAKSNTFNVNGTITGSIVQMPRGSTKICSPITVYGGTMLRGHGPQGTSIRVCDAFTDATANVISLCDTVPHTACFGGQLADFNVTATFTAPGNGSTYIIYTNSAQQARAIQNVSVYGGKRGCLRYDTGYGGAASFAAYDFFCTMFSGAGSDGIVINGGTTLFKFINTIVESSSFSGNGINALGGQITFDGLHSEGITTPVNIAMSTSSYSFTLLHATGGSNCTSLVTLQSTNSAGNFAGYDLVRNGCTNSVNDGQTSGSGAHAVDYRPKDGWVSFNP